MIRGPDDEAREPKYAHIERERRWLIDPARCPVSDGADDVLIEDRYIADTRLRLRRMTGPHRRVVHKLTRKYEADDPCARPIVTAYLTDTEYAVMATLPAAPLVKRRIAFDTNGHRYGVDRFAGRLEGLVLAEIEADDSATLAAIPPPPGAVRDVSDEPSYQGGALATLGRPEE